MENLGNWWISSLFVICPMRFLMWIIYINVLPHCHIKSYVVRKQWFYVGNHKNLQTQDCVSFKDRTYRLLYLETNCLSYGLSNTEHDVVSVRYVIQQDMNEMYLWKLYFAVILEYVALSILPCLLFLFYLFLADVLSGKTSACLCFECVFCNAVWNRRTITTILNFAKIWEIQWLHLENAPT